MYKLADIDKLICCKFGIMPIGIIWLYLNCWIANLIWFIWLIGFDLLICKLDAKFIAEFAEFAAVFELAICRDLPFDL